MAMTTEAIAYSAAAGRAGIETCGQPLSNGRTCVHVKGHSERHSYAWQEGDARYQNVDDKLIDMATGEVVGYTGGVASEIIQQIIAERQVGPEPSAEEKQAKARRVLEVQYGATFPDGCGPVRTIPLAGYEWTYEGTFKTFGYDPEGNYVSYCFETGKIARLYSLNQRRQAVDYARRWGPTAAARKLGIPLGTIKSWVQRGE
jgi:hypothetical protein